MTKEILEQIELFKKYGVNNKYTIKDNKIHIEGSLYLESLTAIPDSNFLNNTVIGGSLDLNSLTAIPDSNFLNNTIIGGSLYLQSLKSIPDSNFLNNTVIGGNLYLESLKSIPDSNFLNNTVIGGNLYLESLTNIKKLEVGYNKDKGYCYFDGILKTVTKVTTKKGYTIYTTPFNNFVIQKGKFTAHANTVKQGILDVEFKIVRDKLEHEPINADTVFTVEYYRMLTGACDLGCRVWLQDNDIPFIITEEGKTKELTPMIVSDLLVILDKSKPYGYDKFKSLLTF